MFPSFRFEMLQEVLKDSTRIILFEIDEELDGCKSCVAIIEIDTKELNSLQVIYYAYANTIQFFDRNTFRVIWEGRKIVPYVEPEQGELFPQAARL